MWPVVAPARAQGALQILGSLVQGLRDAGAVRCLVSSTRAQQDFVDLPFNLPCENAREQGAETLQHAVPQGRVSTHQVQHEYAWLSGRER